MISLVISLLVTVGVTPQNLADATHASAPHEVSVETALAHATAAVAAATPDFPAELLLAMAYRESRYTVDPVSVVGRTLFCGPLQGTAYTKKQCKALQDIPFAYLTTVRELTLWSNDKACRWRRGAARTNCALQGYAAGYAGVASNWQKPLLILKRAANIRARALKLAATKPIDVI